MRDAPSPVPPERADALRRAVRTKYREVADRAAGHFPYPTGRESALGLGYEERVLDALPPELVETFVGVGNPFGIVQPVPGAHVLDLGCGCGLDVLVAARLVGADGRVAGVDLTPEMLERARAHLAVEGIQNVVLAEAEVEALPFEDEAFHLMLSNGALNLVPDKDAAFREMARVLSPGGAFVAADLLVTESVPEAVLASVDAWST